MKPKYIKTPKDLQTTHQAIVNGFLEQALAKTERAKPYVKEALNFYTALKKCNNINDVLNLQKFRSALIAAAGFSDKGRSKFSETELMDALNKVLNKIFNESNSDFREEIVFRYLLTKGDSLGGSMRNLTGSLASEKITRLITMKLEQCGRSVTLKKSKSGKTRSIIWNSRIIFFDSTPKFIGKNIDIILLNFNGSIENHKILLHTPEAYLACGELKGGIDPAGADEHWKTANSALERIRRAFSRYQSRPYLFFVGAAIEASMSEEIFNQLRDGKLAYAANLTKEKQVEDLVEWLINL